MIDNKELKRLLICPYCQKGVIEQLNYFQCFSCQIKFLKKDYIDFVGEIQKTKENEKDLDVFLNFPELFERKYEGARKLVANFGNSYIRNAYIILVKSSKLDFNDKVILEIGGDSENWQNRLKRCSPKLNIFLLIISRTALFMRSSLANWIKSTL